MIILLEWMGEPGEGATRDVETGRVEYPPAVSLRISLQLSSGLRLLLASVAIGKAGWANSVDV